MKLIDLIRTDRVRQKGKKPLPQSLFNVVGALVKKFNLERKSLLEAAQTAGATGAESPVAGSADRLSLFPLLTVEQLHLTEEIIAHFGNPYLVYARRPEDITLSLRLYQLNPDLPVETLQQNSLGLLLVREVNQTS
jgi:hypothetical protein